MMVMQDEAHLVPIGTRKFACRAMCVCYIPTHHALTLYVLRICIVLGNNTKDTLEYGCNAFKLTKIWKCRLGGRNGLRLVKFYQQIRIQNKRYLCKHTHILLVPFTSTVLVDLHFNLIRPATIRTRDQIDGFRSNKEHTRVEHGILWFLIRLWMGLRCSRIRLRSGLPPSDCSYDGLSSKYVVQKIMKGLHRVRYCSRWNVLSSLCYPATGNKPLRGASPLHGCESIQRRW